MIEIKLFELAGAFAEDKDIAAQIRKNKLLPALKRGEEIVLNFEKIDLATQSFVHVLISDLMRKLGNEVLEQISFKHCAPTVKKIIEIVVDYMQERD